MNNKIKTLTQYEEIIGKDNMNQLYLIADKVKNKTVVNVNSTRKGGGVAEILNSLVPLMNELGVKTRWETIEGNGEFFNVTKGFHNALQGSKVKISQKMFDDYIKYNRQNAEKLDLDADLVIIHDPQPAALIQFYNRKNSGKWIWRCHIDVSHPERTVWKFLEKYVKQYDASIFSMSSFSQRLPHPQYLIVPSIDPLSDKNRKLASYEIKSVLKKYNIPQDKPIILQVSRFDKFKDPLGVILAYRLVKKNIDCQLVLAGGGATDDPEGEIVLEEVKREAQGDNDIHILLLPPDSNKEINALQRGADIVLQKSLKEGFGLTVTEALWKGKPTIGGAVGGIVLQVHNHHTGFLVYSIEGAAYRIRYLLHHQYAARRMGRTGQEFVRRNFLITRHLRDYLSLLVAMEQSEKHYITI